MPQFLAPIFLAIGGVIASLPVILHLLNRRQTQKLSFSTTRFILQSKQVDQRHHWFKKLQLPLIRTSILLGLAITFSRPFWPERSIIPVINSQRNVVVIVDCSYSMGNNMNEELSPLTSAKSSVISALQQLHTEDRSALVSLSDHAKLQKQLDENHQLTQIAVDSLCISYRGTNLLPGLQVAESLLQRTTSGSREIWIASDQQKVGWEQVFTVRNTSPKNIADQLSIKFISTTPDQLSTNLAITNLQVERRDYKSIFQARIRNFGLVRQESNISLFLDKKKVANQFISIFPEQTVNVQLLAQLQNNKSEYTGYIEVIDQSVQVDNRRYFCLPPLNQIVLHILEQTKSEMFYLRAALKSMKPIFPIDWTANSQLPPNPSKKYNVIVMQDVKLTKMDQSVLYKFVQQGGRLLITSGNSPWNKPTGLLAELYPCEFNTVLPKSSKVLTQIDFNHPVFQPHQQYKIDFAQIHFDVLRPCLPKPSAYVIASFEDGTPLLIEQVVGQGRVVFFNSRLDRQGTDFPVRSIYLPFLHSLISYLGYLKDLKTDYMVGNTVDLGSILAYINNANQTISIFDPEGQEHRLISQQNHQTIHFSTTELVGIYRARTHSLSNQKETVFSVNIDTSESDLAAYTTDEIMSIIKKRQQISIPSEITGKDPNAQNANIQVEQRQGIWWFILIGVLLLAMIESWLANRH